MEPFFDIPNSVAGVEVLYFPDAEVSKEKGSDKSFASFGSLSVLYFKSYNRFVLQLNDWRYPLLRRLNIQSSGNGSYVLPAWNGFSYNLRINNPGQASLQSLNSLLEGTRKLEASPEDKLTRQPIQKGSETGIKEVIGQTIKQTVQKVQNKAATLTTGTKYLTSTKKRTNLKDIKNKNFRKDAHSRIKKDFFKSSEKLSQEFLKKREELGSAEFRDFESLRKLTNGPVMHLPKHEIEEVILLGKESFASTDSSKPGLMDNLKQGVQGLKENLRGESRNTESQIQSEKTQISVEPNYEG